MINPLFEIKTDKETQDYGLFTIEPLAPGFGHTLGNSLRRVLLTHLKGAAITQIKVQGVRHRFSTMVGLKEDLVELILNLKQVLIQYEGDKEVKLEIDKTGPGEVKASDIQAPANVKVVNPDLVLANLATKNNRLKVEMIVKSGSGYLTIDEQPVDKLGVIPIDASFSPVRRVNFRIEAARVGNRTDFDRLVLEIFTSGTVKPSVALKDSAGILLEYFQQIIDPKKAPKEEKAQLSFPSETLKLTVEEIDLPTRIANTLRKGGYGTVEDLTNASLTNLAQVKNLGEKSVKLIQQALAKKDLMIKGA